MLLKITFKILQQQKLKIINNKIKKSLIYLCRKPIKNFIKKHWKLRKKQKPKPNLLIYLAVFF